MSKVWMDGHKITQLSDLTASNHNKTWTSCDGDLIQTILFLLNLFSFHHISSTDGSNFVRRKMNFTSTQHPYHLKVWYENLCIWWLVRRRGSWAVIINLPSLTTFLASTQPSFRKTMLHFFSGGTKICNEIFRIGVTPPFPENSVKKSARLEH